MMQPSTVQSIIDLPPKDTPAGQALVEQAARVLMAGFRESSSPEAWSDLDSALEEVREFFQPGRICRLAVSAAGEVLGWVGGISNYAGHAWELHPLVVHPDFRRQGIGRLLVADLEIQVRQQGGNTIYLGTDDENGSTSLSGADLYPNVWEHVAHIRNLNHHPYEFYQQVGFVIIGILPDANGPGKPDIFMAKRVNPQPPSEAI